MNAKYQDLHLTTNHQYLDTGIVKRGIHIETIEFYDNRITILYYENNIRYEMQIPFTELKDKMLVLD